MTQEQFEKCIPWEQTFRWALNSNFVHLSNGEFNQIAAIYKEVFGEGLTASQMTCNTCRLKSLKRLGEEYFKIQQEKAKEQKEENIAEKPKKKGGRPPKINVVE